jgi:hypothetical protein
VLFVQGLGVRPEIVDAMQTWRFTAKLGIVVASFAVALGCHAPGPPGRRSAQSARDAPAADDYAERGYRMGNGHISQGHLVHMGGRQQLADLPALQTYCLSRRPQAG